MPKVAANGIEIYYEQFGEPSGRPLLLICGLGAHMTSWPQGFLDSLVTAGFFVTTYDNRDVGLSTHLDHFGEPDSAAILFGQAEAPYLIADMAADGAELVRILGLGAQHVVGVSMGGMIAQQFAINFPELTLSLTSIMSTPAPLEVGTSTPECLAMLTRPRSEDLETFLIEEIENWQLTNGSAHPLDEAWVREQAITAMNRGRNPIGVLRHLCAVVGSPDRRPALSKLTVPVVVLHGDEDPLVTPSGGEATAAVIAHAKHVVYPGMGHSLPEPLWDVVAAEIVAVADLA